MLEQIGVNSREAKLMPLEEAFFRINRYTKNIKDNKNKEDGSKDLGDINAMDLASLGLGKRRG